MQKREKEKNRYFVSKRNPEPIGLRFRFITTHIYLHTLEVEIDRATINPESDCNRSTSGPIHLHLRPLAFC